MSLSKEPLKFAYQPHLGVDDADEALECCEDVLSFLQRFQYHAASTPVREAEAQSTLWIT